MSDLIYSVAIEDDYYVCVVGDRPAWFKHSMKGLRFIPKNHDEVQDALIIYGHNYLDFSKDIKDQIVKMIDECHKEQGPDALLDPWVSHKLLMLDAKKELKNLEFKANLLVVNHDGLAENIDLGCINSACKAECIC